MTVDVTATLIAPIRDVSEYLEETVVRLNEVLSLVFNRVNIVLVESDSSDRTVPLGLKLLTEKKISFFETMGNLAERHPGRSDRIAVARNRGLSVAKQEFFCDYYIFADLDGLNNSVSLEGILSCFKYTGWSAMLANQYGRYYDIWALRHPVWCPGDCWQDYHKLKLALGERLARWVAVGSKQIHIPSTCRPIEVESAFGGFGIYRAEAVRDAAWCGHTIDGIQVCEWVNFNRSVVGPIVINPMLRNSSPFEHCVDYPTAYSALEDR